VTELPWPRRWLTHLSYSTLGMVELGRSALHASRRYAKQNAENDVCWTVALAVAVGRCLEAAPGDVCTPHHLEMVTEAGRCYPARAACTSESIYQLPRVPRRHVLLWRANNRHYAENARQVDNTHNKAVQPVAFTWWPNIAERRRHTLFIDTQHVLAHVWSGGLKTTLLQCVVAKTVFRSVLIGFRL